MPTTDIYQEELAALRARLSEIRVDNFAKRQEAKAALAVVRQRAGDRQRARHQLAQRQEAEQDADLAQAEDLAEREHHAACSKALLDRAFDAADPGSLISLLAQWRREPGRQATVKITAAWAELDKRALELLGAPLGKHVLATAVIDLIAADNPGSLVYLSQSDYGANAHVIEGLGAFMRAPGPKAAEDALGLIEQWLVTAGRRGVGQTPSAEHLARHALRRLHATHADLSRAQGVFNEQVERARLQRLQAEQHTPPANAWRGPISEAHFPRPQPTAADAPPITPLDRPLMGYPT